MNDKDYIYLDNNATTKIDPQVMEIMTSFYIENYGNPSSRLNAFGKRAAFAVEDALDALAECFEAKSRNDFIITSGATESNNMAISGILRSVKNPHIIVSEIEHSSILEVCRYWTSRGVECTYLPVDKEGKISCVELEHSIQPETCLISIMAANNEIGTIQPIEEIVDIAKRNHILVHTDATQYLYYDIINVRKIPFNIISFSGHKIHGPKGVGALYLDSEARMRIQPIILGGGQQNNLRSGTINVPGIAGLASALTILKENQKRDNIKIKNNRDLLLKKLEMNYEVHINGSLHDRLAGNLNLFFPKIPAITLIGKLPHIAFSTSAACDYEKGNNSHVLQAIGLKEEEIKSSIRIGLSRFTTEKEILNTADELLRVLQEIELERLKE